MTHQLATDWTAIPTLEKLASLISCYTLPHYSRYFSVIRRAKVLVEGLAAIVGKPTLKCSHSCPDMHRGNTLSIFEVFCIQRLAVQSLRMLTEAIVNAWQNRALNTGIPRCESMCSADMSPGAFRLAEHINCLSVRCKN